MPNRVFDHVIVIMLENEFRGLVLENPYMLSLAKQGVNMANYFGTYHPSQTNYIASIAGEQCGWSSDDQVWPPFTQQTLPDLMAAKGVAWKAYMEDFPGCPWDSSWANREYYANPSPPYPNYVPPFSYSPPTSQGIETYQQKHNAFSSYMNVQKDQEQWQCICTLEQFFQDVDAGTLPQYAWISPNMWNNGHWQQGTDKDIYDGPDGRAPLIEQSAEWLKNDLFGPLNFPGPSSKLPPNTLVVVTYDESDFEHSMYSGPNQIYTVLLGDVVEPGTVDEEPRNHYSLIRTIEENFELGSLGKNDTDANWFRFLWNESYQLGEPVTTSPTTSGSIAAAAYDGLLYLVTQDGQGTLSWQTFDGKTWSAPQSIGQTTAGAIAMAASAHGLVLAYQTDRSISTVTYSATTKEWSAPQHLPVEPGPVKGAVGRSLALTPMPDGSGLMLAYLGLALESGSVFYPIYSMILGSSGAGSPVSLGKATFGDLTLASLGSTLYLVYNSTSIQGLDMVSYETASYNTISNNPFKSPNNNTVAGIWSGSAYPVGQVGPDTSAHMELPPSEDPTLAQGAAVMAELDGCLHLMTTAAAGGKPTPGTSITQIFALTGIMTAQKPTSLTPVPGTSNGYGTLMEVGWGPVTSLDDAFNRSPNGPLAMASFNGSLYIFFTAPDQQTIQMAIGGYA